MGGDLLTQKMRRTYQVRRISCLQAYRQSPQILYNDSVTEALLQTKLHIPALRASFVPRPRLVARLNAGLEGRLILLSAPAGYGKTTLVTEWLTDCRLQIEDFRLGEVDGRIDSRQNRTDAPEGGVPKAGRRVAWLSLEEGDNDPTRFLAYLIAAVQQVRSGFGESIGARLRSPQPPPAEALLTALVNELAEVPAPFILVLDDYHVIHSLPIHQQVTFLLEHQPCHMHLVLMTREDPLLPIARLRARGQVLEIRQQDLCFTLQETADFLERAMGPGLSPENVAALELRTEGWIAGLQLAALSMQGTGDPEGFIQDFTGSNRFVLDYLIEEVFKRQSAEVQDFLLKTSILERLCAPLCDSVIRDRLSGSREGKENILVTEHLPLVIPSQAILEHLDHSNLFIIPLDQSRTWYRYHHLFSELLRLRLRASPAHDETRLHQRASQWYESQYLFRDAVEHSLAAQDWGNAARLTGVANEGMFKHGEYVTLLNWCGRIPQQVVHSSENLCLVHAWAALMASQFEIAAPLLEQAEQLAEPNSHFMGQVAAAQAFLARAKRDNARAIEKSEQALALLPDTEIVNRGVIAMNLGLAYWHVGQLARAEPVLVQACDLCGRTGNQYALLTAKVFLARVFASRGKIHQALEMEQGMIQAGGQIPILCLAHYDLAIIHHEWNALQKAWEHFELGFALSQRSGNVEFQQAGQLVRAILLHALGNEAEAISAHAEAEAMARDFPAAIRSRVAAFGVQMALARDDAQMLARWEPQVDAESDAHLFYRFMGLTHARLLIARGKKDEAAETLKEIYETATKSGWGYGMIVIRILQSLAAKNENEAMQFISEALRMGRPESFMRSFVDAESGIVPVLQEATRRGIEADYAGRILSALGADHSSEIRAPAGLVESLSEREIEVLRLVTAGLSNREIAAKLVISPGTAKTHIHNLYGKLDVRNRTEAAMRAKELNLV